MVVISEVIVKTFVAFICIMSLFTALKASHLGQIHGRIPASTKIVMMMTHRIEWLVKWTIVISLLAKACVCVAFVLFVIHEISWSIILFCW
jgi:hypothetical protein